MLLVFMMKLQDLQQQSDTAVANDEEDIHILEAMNDLREKFYSDFRNEYGFRFEDFHEILEQSYDYTP